MTKVKICGITNLQDARHAVASGADMLGFNFYLGSKRFIEPSVAAEIVAGLQDFDVAKVGVFVNAEVAEIAGVARSLGLDAVQLHGDETPGYVSELIKTLLLPTTVIKAVRPRSWYEAMNALDFDSDSILVDSHCSHEYGGTGKKAEWQFALDLWGSVPCIYLAGGLTPYNVVEAIRFVNPYAVDVASGVESSLGKKDPAKVAAFVRAAKEAL